jgi:hypothetical protein
MKIYTMAFLLGGISIIVAAPAPDPATPSASGVLLEAPAEFNQSLVSRNQFGKRTQVALTTCSGDNY